MASITRRGDGWSVRYRDHRGRSRRIQCPTARSAREVKLEIEIAQARGVPYTPKRLHAIPTLQGAAEVYLAHMHRVKAPKTASGATTALDHMLRVAPDHSELHVLSLDFLGDLWDALDGRAIRTKSNYIGCVQRFWLWAWEHPTWGASVPRPRKLDTPAPVDTPVVAPTWDDLDTVIGAFRRVARVTTLYRVAVLMRYTGLRVSQAQRLRWGDLDVHTADLVIRGELGKSRAERRGRIVPVSRHLVEEVCTWPRRGDTISSSASTTTFDCAGMRAAWARSGVPRELWSKRPHHCFRRGFISGLIRRNASREAVEFLVGHDTGIAGVYTDPRALGLRETVDLVPQIGGGKIVRLDTRRNQAE